MLYYRVCDRTFTGFDKVANQRTYLRAESNSQAIRQSTSIGLMSDVPTSIAPIQIPGLVRFPDNQTIMLETGGQAICSQSEQTGDDFAERNDSRNSAKREN